MITNPKVLLINLGFSDRTFNGANKALPVLASSLHEAGFNNVSQFDLENPSCTLKDLLEQAKSADLIGISGMSSQLEKIDEITLKLNAVKKESTPIIVGGYVTKGIKNVLKYLPSITAFFNGEGETGIVDICKSINNETFKEDMSSIRGLCYLDSLGGYHESLAERVRELKTDQNFNFIHLPHTYNMDIFKDKEGKLLKTAQLFSQRGCPYKCGFCNKSLEEKVVVHVKDEHFEEMVEKLSNQGYEAIYLDDDTETINQSEFRSKMEILQKYGMKVGLNTRIDTEAQRLKSGINNIEFAKQHGAVYTFFGVEHTDPGVLFAIGKFSGSESSQKEKAEQYASNVKLVFEEMRKVGLPSSYFIILGLPKKVEEGYRPTTLEEDKEAIRFALEECNPDFLNFNILRFMPGTIAADLPCTDNYENPFACVRPTGKDPITAAHFLPKIHKEINYVPQEYHPVFKAFESIDNHQPRSTAIAPKRAYETIKYTIELINQRILSNKKPTELFLDKGILEKGLITKQSDGRYSIQSYKQFSV